MHPSPQPDEYFANLGLDELANQVKELQLTRTDLSKLNTAELKKIFSVEECLAILKYRKAYPIESPPVTSSSSTEHSPSTKRTTSSLVYQVSPKTPHYDSGYNMQGKFIQCISLKYWELLWKKI